MAQWRDCTLGDLLEIRHGFAFLGEHFADTGTHIVLTPGNFFDEGGFKHKGDKEKWYRGPIPADYVLEAGDLIVAMTEQAEGLLGSSAVIPCGGLYLHNQRLGRVQLRDAKQTDKRFVYHLFNSKPVRQQIRASASGAKIRHTAPSRISGVKVRVPPLPVQQRIAGILSAYDELIENSQRRIKILESMARALYREWFVHFRFPGHENHPRVASALGEIPEGWEVKKIADLCESVSYGYTASASREEVGPKFLRITDIVPALIDWAGVPFCEIPQAKVSKYVLAPGDIVIARTGATTGYAKRLNRRHPATVFASYLVRVRAASGVSNRMLGILMESDFYKQFIKNNIGGAAQPQANAVVLTSMRVARPPAALADKFDSLTEPILDEAELLAVKIQNLRRTRDLLLPRLLSGQTEVEGA
jgi:type I restriction enzyme, S subunit